MKVAIFPGSFDPFTRGHEAIVAQALTMFDKVVIAIGENIAKRGFLTIEQRAKLIRELYAKEPRIEVKCYNSLTGECAQEVGACAIIRGVRNTIDFEYEKNMAQVNSRLFPQIATVLLLTPAELSDISSSTIRELVTFKKDVSEMMPRGVKLEEYMTK
ncbi:MAG: pantetheine-phosphate adenylyltransferase [Alistipes sp.]|nr:pantetheine-phosphate adenylyltransferase [Alistipes sp.]